MTTSVKKRIVALNSYRSRKIEVEKQNARVYWLLVSKLTHTRSMLHSIDRVILRKFSPRFAEASNATIQFFIGSVVAALSPHKYIPHNVMLFGILFPIHLFRKAPCLVDSLSTKLDSKNAMQISSRYLKFRAFEGYN